MNQYVSLSPRTMLEESGERNNFSMRIKNKKRAFHLLDYALQPHRKEQFSQ